MDRLLDAAEAILEKGGLHALDMRSVGEGAGLTTGAIYARFTNKEGLLEALFDRFEADNAVLLSHFEQRVSAGEFGRLSDVVQAFLASLAYVYEKRGALIAALIEGSYARTEFVQRARDMMDAAGKLLAYACEKAGAPMAPVRALAASRIAFASFDQQLFLRRGQSGAARNVGARRRKATPCDDIPMHLVASALMGILDEKRSV